EIVVREPGVARVDEIGRDDQADHDAAEQAGPRLFHAEAEELVDGGGEAPLAGPVAELRLALDETGERRPDGGSAVAPLVRFLQREVRERPAIHLGLWPCKIAKESLNCV